MTNSKQKGNRGERELAKKLRELGCTGARRTQQFSGYNGDDDVDGGTELERFFIECKRVEQLNLHQAMEKAQNQCPSDKIPVIMHRKNGRKWLATFDLTDAIERELQHLRNEADYAAFIAGLAKKCIADCLKEEDCEGVI